MSEVIIDVKELNDDHIGIDLINTEKDVNNDDKLKEKKEMKLYKVEGSKLYFKLDTKIQKAGTIRYAFRMYPKNEDLAHRMDFCYVRWFN